MNKSINKLMIAATIFALIIATIAGYFIWKTYEAHNSLDFVRNNLNTTFRELNTVENKLSGTQERLQEEIYKSSKLEESLSDANKEIENINSELEKTKLDLDTANTTIEDLKSNEYSLVYMGNFKLTQYCCEEYEHICGTGNGITATGTKVTAGRTIAVDPSVIPYGTRVYIEGFGWRVAEDCGGAVDGKHIDIAAPTHQEALSIGTRNGGVWMLVMN